MCASSPTPAISTSSRRGRKSGSTSSRTTRPTHAAAPIIAAAHAYQVSSARDELPAKFHVNKDLLARAPNLLIVSTGGAGYDTVNVKDCTDAGVLVVNQTGGNADAVAAHVLGMMLMLSKQVVQVNNALRKGTMKDRNLYMGNDINNKTIGIVGLGNVGRRLAKLCATVFDMTVLAYDPLSRREDHRRAQRHQGRRSTNCCGAPTSSRSTARSTTPRAT